MSEKRISVTRALVELKRFDERIQKAITGGVFVGRTIGRDVNKKMVGTSDTVAEVTLKIQGSFDRVQSLMAARSKLKSEIVMSNAATKVTVCGEEVSVAEAIEMKSTVAFRTQFLNAMRHQLAMERSQIDRASTALDVEIETSLNALYGADSKKIDADTAKSVSDVKKNQKDQALLDPSKVEDKMAAVEADILNLSSELDFVLSESNARTTVNFD